MIPDDKARIGYESANRKVDEVARVIWSTNASMTTANSVLLAFSGFAAVPTVGFVVPIVGIFVCIAWLLMLGRHRAYIKFWYAWARHYERLIFGQEPSITVQGNFFSQGLEGRFPTGSKEPAQRIPWLFRRSANWAVYMIVACFIVMYIILLLILLYLCLKREVGAEVSI